MLIRVKTHAWFMGHLTIVQLRHNSSTFTVRDILPVRQVLDSGLVDENLGQTLRIELCFELPKSLAFAGNEASVPN